MLPLNIVHHLLLANIRYNCMYVHVVCRYYRAILTTSGSSLKEYRALLTEYRAFLIEYRALLMESGLFLIEHGALFDRIQGTF